MNVMNKIEKQAMNSNNFTICQPWQLPNNCSLLLSYSHLFEKDTNSSKRTENIMKSNIFKSDKPTRHIALYSSQLLTIGHVELFQALQENGEIRTMYPYLSAGITIISYFKLLDAQQGLNLIKTEFVDYQACYAKPCLISKKLNENVFITINGASSACNYMEHLLKLGTIYSLSEANITSQLKIINIEYDDERVCDKLVNELNNVYIGDSKLQVLSTVNDQFLCTCNDKDLYLSSSSQTKNVNHHYYQLMHQQHIISNETKPFSQEENDIPPSSSSFLYSNNINNHSFFSTNPFDATRREVREPVALPKSEEQNMIMQQDEEEEDDDYSTSSSSGGNSHTNTSNSSWKRDSKRESIDSQASFMTNTTTDTTATNTSSIITAVNKNEMVLEEEVRELSIATNASEESNGTVDGESNTSTVSSSSNSTPTPTTTPASYSSIAVKRENNSNTTTTTSSSNANEFDIERIKSGQDTRTTFMIRNIPNKYTQQMLIDCINTTHANTYDFLYLRIDFKNKCNVGYAFINFINVESVLSFAKDRVGKKWQLFNSDKRCSLSYANIQGRDALVRKFKNSQVMEEDEAFRPKLFYSNGPNKGKEQLFPKSDQPLRESAVADTANGNSSSNSSKSTTKHNYNHHRNNNKRC